MGIARRGRELPVQRHQPELKEFEGKWVAVKGGRVIASADTSTRLAWSLRKLPDQVRSGAVAEFVQRPVDGYVTGVG